MKKFLRIGLVFAFTLSTIGFTQVNANEEENDDKDGIPRLDINYFDPVQVDQDLYGTDITEEYVIYDAVKGIDNIMESFYNSNSRSLVLTEDFQNYKRFFSKVAWIRRDGVMSLSVYHTIAGRLNKEESWRLLLTAHYDDNTWYYARKGNPTSGNSMYHQYTCHVDWAGAAKNPYNLEPAKPDKGYWGFVGSACN
ncbi:MAG: DUF2599 domain-containing protein [Coprobacillus sp.]